MGFGILRDPVGGEGGLTKELQQVKLPLLSTDTCQRIINQGKDSPSAVTDNVLCAGLLGGWKGGCYGDSGETFEQRHGISIMLSLMCFIKCNPKITIYGKGGPIMVLNPVTKTYTQVGITSWVVSPCGGHPTVFTRLSSYVNWVHQHVQKCEPRTLSKVHASWKFLNVFAKVLQHKPSIKSIKLLIVRGRICIKNLRGGHFGHDQRQTSFALVKSNVLGRPQALFLNGTDLKCPHPSHPATAAYCFSLLACNPLVKIFSKYTINCRCGFTGKLRPREPP